MIDNKCYCKNTWNKMEHHRDTIILRCCYCGNVIRKYKMEKEDGR